jgi:peptidoglycan/LPS O-acetylase OafA/YrhL
MTAQFRVNNFDLLRILAATQVLLVHICYLHAAQPAWWPVLQEFPGVAIFFVISGFLISASYERRPDVRSYARNRVLRIYPGLWCLILVTIIGFSLLGVDFLNPETALWLPSQLLGAIYTPRFLEHFGFGSYNGSLWTIPVELQFYMALPVVHWLAMRSARPTRTFGLIWLAFVVIGTVSVYFVNVTSPPDTQPLMQKIYRYSFIPHFYLFLTGVMLQRLKVYESRVVAGKGLYWVAAYLLAYALLPAKGPFHIPIMLLLAVTSIALAYTAPTWSRKILRGNDISYGVYIYHGLLLNVFIELGWMGTTLQVFALGVCSYAAAAVSWVAVERACLRRKRFSVASATSPAVGN